MKKTIVKYPDIVVRLARFGGDQIDSMYAVMEQLRKNNVPEEEISEFNGEIMGTESATQFLDVIKKWVHCIDFAQFASAVYEEDYLASQEEAEVFDWNGKRADRDDY